MADRTLTIFAAAGLCVFASPALAAHMTAQQAAASKQAVTDALNGLSLTPIQRISIRDYVGQGRFDITSFHTPTGEALILRDPQSHDYVGEAVIRTTGDGAVYVDKTTGATFAWNAPPVELPFLNRRTEEAENVLNGSEDVNVFNSKPPPADSRSLTVPALSVERGVDVGAVRQSVAVFQKDGHGYEEGMSTNLGSAGGSVVVGAGGEAESGKGFAGVRGEIGAKLTKVELFVNYFGAPTADEKGEFTRRVIGGSAEAHGTLANAEGKVGCFEDKGCTGDWSAGALGIGLGLGVKFGNAVKLEMEPEKIEGDSGLIDDDSVNDPSEPETDEDAQTDDASAPSDDKASDAVDDQAQDDNATQTDDPSQSDDQDENATQTDDQAQDQSQADDQDQNATQTDDQARDQSQSDDQDQNATQTDDQAQDQSQADDQDQNATQTDDQTQDQYQSDDQEQSATQTDDQTQDQSQTDDQDQNATQTDDQAQDPSQSDDQDQSATQTDDQTQDQYQSDDQNQNSTQTDDQTQSQDTSQDSSQSGDTGGSTDSGDAGSSSSGDDSGGK